MAGSGKQPHMGMTEVVAVDAGVGRIGSEFPHVRDVLCGRCAVSPVLWVVDVDYGTMHWDELVQLPPQGGLQTYGEATTEGTGWYVGVPPAGEGNIVGRPTGGGDLRLLYL